MYSSYVSYTAFGGIPRSSSFCSPGRGFQRELPARRPSLRLRMSEGAATLVFVSEACADISFEARRDSRDGGFEDLAAKAWSLTLPPPEQRSSLLYGEAAR